MTADLREQLEAALGPGYPIERELEGGGMSRVFLARDRLLQREIVVKLLRPELHTGVSVERFQREIHLAARLQHPLIVPLLSAGSVAGLPYYTMPFIRGESLRELLSRQGRVPVHQAVHILRDIASALAHAHREGVVHRDIKPENVLLTGGVAVVTDFGVAKAVDVAATGGAVRAGLTSGGLALGTPAYMSPEQASADPTVDHRSDIYSFGCLAYELLRGTPPFGTRAPPQLLAAQVLEAPAHVSTADVAVPPALAALVMQCLEKRAEARPQTVDALIAALDALATPSVGVAAADVRRPRSRVGRALAGMGVVVLVGLGLWRPWETEAPIPAIASTRPVTSSPELELDAAISPDGKHMAYAAGTLFATRIYMRQIEGGSPVLLSGDIPGEHRWPKWSADGTQIAFTGIQSDSSAIYVVPYTGGAPRRFAEGSGRGRRATPAWSPDGRAIYFAGGLEEAILRVALEGGEPEIVAKAPEPHSVAISPDGRWLAFVSGNPSVSMFNSAPSAIWLVASTGGIPQRISDSTSANLSPVWSPDGKHLFFISDQAGSRDVYRLEVSRDGRPAGTLARLTTGLGTFSFSMSRDGTRALYTTTRIRSHIWMSPIGIGDGAPATRVTREAQAIEGIDLSPDGRWLVYNSDRDGNQDIYKIGIAGGDPIRLTRDPAPDFVPEWSADGRAIAYYSMRAGTRDIRVMDAEGRDDHAATADPGQEIYPTWSPDGNAIAYTLVARRSPINIITRTGPRSWSPARTLVAAGEVCRKQVCQVFAKWSPDGRWIAFAAIPEGVYLVSPSGGAPRRLAGSGELGGLVRYVAWGSDPTRVYALTFQGRTAAFWEIPISGGRPRPVLRLNDPDGQPRRQEFATDGRRLFYTLPADESDIWLMELRR